MKPFNCLLANVLCRVLLPVVLLFTSVLVHADEALSLLGEGARKKAFITVYDAALHVPRPLHGQAGEAISEADSPMKMVITLRSKLVTAERMTESLMDGFGRSMDGNTAPLGTEIESMVSAIHGHDLASGDVITLSYSGSPQAVTRAEMNGEALVEISGLEFKQALFGIWLSDDPVQASLKKALTGQ